MSRRCLLVLGMHRSGTSALTRVLGLLGATLPRETMPAAADNPLGYWEAPRIARFNNRLLESAGTRWNDDAPIPDDWFADPARAADHAAASNLIATEFPGAATFALKDPRICRLLPLWRTVFAAAAIEPHAVILVRDPREVAQSLAARAAVPEFRPAAIPARERGLLLWLRYLIDAERHSRGLPRQAIEYRHLLADWRAAIAPLIAAGAMPPPAAAAAAAVDAFLDPSLRRQRAAEADEPAVDAPPCASRTLLAAFRGDPTLAASGEAAVVCDAMGPRLDRLVAAYMPLRRTVDPGAVSDPWSAALLAALGRLPNENRPAAPRTAVFLSGVPTSVGHVYRVEHAVAALQAAGWSATWLPATAPEAVSRAAQAGLVVVFRAAWSDTLAAVAADCRRRGVPLVYDVDDLIFDPDVMNDGSIAVLAALPEHDRRQFVAAAAGHAEMLARADAAVLSTRPLAAAAAPRCRRVAVLPNSLGPMLQEAAAVAWRTVAKPSAADGRPRLVFASGTPSHDRDFTVAVDAIARLFTRRPEPILVLVGHVDPAKYPSLRPFADRIECRPLVPLSQLFTELARGDVNLAPLEADNRFCEAKSAVRCLAAAVVGVPTVASATGPLRESIVDGETGFICPDAAAWEVAVDRLVTDETLRRRFGEAARLHALAEYGWDAYRERAAAVFGGMVAGS